MDVLEALAPMWTQTVTTQDELLRVAYSTASTHCASVSVDIYLDGVLKGTTGVLAPVQGSGWFHLGDVPAGTHTVGLVAHSPANGCNVGYIESWGGELWVNAVE